MIRPWPWPWPWPDDEGREGGLFALFDGVRTQANRARGKKEKFGA